MYLRFASVTPNQWDMFVPAKSAKPIVRIIRRNGQCSAAITTDRPVSEGELSALALFVSERGAEAACN